MLILTKYTQMYYGIQKVEGQLFKQLNDLLESYMSRVIGKY